MLKNKFIYGLIGKGIEYSFSKNYFNDKFKTDGLNNHLYNLFRLLLNQIVPATSQVNYGLHNVVESHILERNKYQHKAPLIKNINKIIIEARVGNIATTQPWTSNAPVRALEREGLESTSLDEQKDQKDRDLFVEIVQGKLPEDK